jgi:citryl-CoA lyase
MAKTIKHNESTGEAYWGDKNHLVEAQTRSFASMVYELLSEKVPTEAELKIFELILNLSIDHGPDTPSAVKVIEEAKKGETISEAVSEGIEEINDVHGGAQEKLMEVLYQVNSGQLTVGSLITEYLKEGKRLAGFGHRIYKTEDPRAQLILNTLKGNGFSSEFIQIATELEKELANQKGNKLPLNIDGAIAVVLCTLGWDPKLGKAVFIIARTPGLCGQFLNVTVS